MTAGSNTRTTSSSRNLRLENEVGLASCYHALVSRLYPLLLGKLLRHFVDRHSLPKFNMELFTPDFHSPINTNIVVVMIVGVQKGLSEATCQ